MIHLHPQRNTLRLLTSIWLTALVVALATASGAQPDPQAPESPPPAETGSKSTGGVDTQDPKWFEKLLAREAEPIKARPLASEDGRFRTLVAAEVLSKPETVDGDYYVQLNLGTDTPMECWIYPEGHDLASSHQTFSKGVFDHMTENFGEIELKAIHRVDAGAFGAHPYLALEWIYRVKSPRGPLAGHVKHMGANKGEASVHCLHNESGYSKTFEKVFRGLVDHLEVEGAPPDPYYQEVTVVTVGELRTGVARTTLTRDSEGDTKIVEKVSLLVPVDQQTLAASDTYNIQFSSPDGDLINEVEVGAENGELTTQLKLDPAEEGDWHVSGTFKSKDIDSSLGSKKIPSTLGQMFALREFLAKAKAGDEIAFSEWSAQADPTTFTEVRVHVDARTKDGVRGRLELGPMKLDATFDGNGSVKSASLSMGAVAMGLRRIYVEGALPHP